jgi:hypothetical protein
MNWTVPVTPGPFFADEVTVAFSVTEAPEATVVELAVTAALVGTVPVVVMEMVPVPTLLV